MSLRNPLTFAMLVFAVMILAPEASGQEMRHEEATSGSSGCEFLWGPRASFDIFSCEKSTDMSPHDPDEIGLGASAGVAARFMWHSRWFVESGLFLSYGNAFVPVTVWRDDGKGAVALHDSYTLSRGAIQLPVHLGVRWDINENLGIGVFTGVRLSWGFAGSLSNGPSYMPEFDLYGDNGVWRRFGVAPVIGVEFWCARNMSVSVAGNLGVNNMARKPIFDTSHMNESECRIAYTYWFGR